MRSPGGRELSLSACPRVGNRPPRKKKIANPRGCARGGMVTGRIEPCITSTPVKAVRNASVRKIQIPSLSPVRPPIMERSEGNDFGTENKTVVS